MLSRRREIISTIETDSMTIPPTLTNGVYQIYTAEQLYWLQDSGNVTEENGKGILRSDIYYNTNYTNYQSWLYNAPKRTGAYSRSAKYLDGDGHTIYGFYTAYGYFSNSSSPGATIKNVRFKNCTFINRSQDNCCVASLCRAVSSMINVCVDSSYFITRNNYTWMGATIFSDDPSLYTQSIIKNIYSTDCTLKGSYSWGHAGILTGRTEVNNASIYNAYANTYYTDFNFITGGNDRTMSLKYVYKKASVAWDIYGGSTQDSCADYTDAEMATQSFCDILNKGSSEDTNKECATWHWKSGMLPYLFDWVQTQHIDPPKNPQDTVSGGMVLTGIENKYLYPSISRDAVAGGMALTGIENKYLYPSITGDAVTGGMALTGIENKYLYPGISGDAVTGGMALTGITMEEV